MLNDFEFLFKIDICKLILRSVALPKEFIYLAEMQMLTNHWRLFSDHLLRNLENWQRYSKIGKTVWKKTPEISFCGDFDNMTTLRIFALLSRVLMI